MQCKPAPGSVNGNLCPQVRLSCLQVFELETVELEHIPEHKLPFFVRTRRRELLNFVHFFRDECQSMQADANAEAVLLFVS